MRAYMYRAALLCEDCGRGTCERLTRQGKRPKGMDPANEHTWDSDDYPKGPYPDGGGEADYAAHCDMCACALDNPLTAEGERAEAERAKAREWVPNAGNRARARRGYGYLRRAAKTSGEDISADGADVDPDERRASLRTCFIDAAADMAHALAREGVSLDDIAQAFMTAGNHFTTERTATNPATTGGNEETTTTNNPHPK